MIQDKIQQKTDELQKNIDELQKKIDELQKKIDELPVKCYDKINDKEINRFLICPSGLGLIIFKIRIYFLTLHYKLL